jgi:nicotinate-nucleotide adenylyltransferase
LASDVEFKLPRPSYTIDTLTYLKEKYPGNEFSVVMGSDSFQNIEKWKNYERLVSENNIVIYKRPGFETPSGANNITELTDTPLLEISSTSIRSLIKSRKSIRYLVPEKVAEEIETCGYYRK